MVDCSLIAYYMNLAKSIYRHKKRLKSARIGFFNQTMSSYVTSNEHEIFSKGFSVENNVINFVDAQRRLEETIKICEFKHKHFTEFFRTLQRDDQIYLKERYLQEEEIINDRADRECFDMIQEIEEAASYRFLGVAPALYVEDAPDIGDVSEEEFVQAFDSAFLKMVSRLGS